MVLTQQKVAAAPAKNPVRFHTTMVLTQHIY